MHYCCRCDECCDCVAKYEDECMRCTDCIDDLADQWGEEYDSESDDWDDNDTF